MGRPSLNEDKIKTALKMYDSNEYSVKEITQQVGISQGKLYKEINKRKIKLIRVGADHYDIRILVLMPLVIYSNRT